MSEDYICQFCNEPITSDEGSYGIDEHRAHIKCMPLESDGNE
jgi:hypothetical protein